MGYTLGIDLGSTTTKAILLDANDRIVGRGLTNTRSNYEVATAVAESEAKINAHFTFLKEAVDSSPKLSSQAAPLLNNLENRFHLVQHLHRVNRLRRQCLFEAAADRLLPHQPRLTTVLNALFDQIHERAERSFSTADVDRSRFFRDIVGSEYMALAEEQSRESSIALDLLMGLYDKSILVEENQVLDLSFVEAIQQAVEAAGESETLTRVQQKALREVVEEAASQTLEVDNMVGTGYGRQRLPFRKDQIRSEILCHGLGAHYFFPGTRTVLDIGGQDTKAIQVDSQGIVTSFQMNDRCAAGCGRYLGYIADELNLGLHQLGPLALQAKRPVRITSTCTVFAGAELRERLSMGDAREDILDGLHRAIILRAMSLLARSGGITDEFTFTGGVAKNPAAVRALTRLVEENYGTMKINIHPDSIFTGAVGAALYARHTQGGIA
ncbi:MAG: BadF/BadG/BcrA/BcrD ATPase family protein [Acidobacteriia bacterium]|nr:BadF/BadG/BcrA/BcrD ATPase family protein [Terriglobia bacterium]